jgi:hypothetical protein
VQPETTYARLGEDRIAYQALGEGPDLVRDLVAGSDRTLADRGTRQLKGVEGAWQLFAVTDG